MTFVTAYVSPGPRPSTPVRKFSTISVQLHAGNYIRRELSNGRHSRIFRQTDEISPFLSLGCKNALDSDKCVDAGHKFTKECSVFECKQKGKNFEMQKAKTGQLQKP